MYKDLAKRVAAAKPSSGGVYWEPGKYLVQIDVVKVHEGRKGADFFVVEGDNLESSNPERPAGARCSWVFNTAQDAAPGNIKSFVAAALSCPADDVDDDVIEEVLSAENPLNGKIVRLQVVLTETKSGGEFSKHNWQPVTEEVQKQAKELRKKAGL
jgi:hypothetical protein